MHATERVAAPIYDRLIAERGDVVSVAARTAERTRREVAEVLDFGFPHVDGPAPDTDEDDDARAAEQER
ncbi:hypothetical protein [Streptomyces sp. NEAU-W12]|uniref:hypothetical protein n=1 Tax=Streptomyces sp. NEAU-W12 TaxID=2994668 RepID=UPI00224A9FA8|nr:hypothetical protein [Streptomyces sp. NEAU-W12]MCX2923343.1 hypothetical protein [Streptomyces sp. NEAU-W12]